MNRRASLVRKLEATVLLVGLAVTTPAIADPIVFRTAGPAGSMGFSVAGDFDGDGDPDVAGTLNAGAVIWSTNSGGTLSAPTSVTVPFPIRALAAGDLDGDGRADLVGCDAAAADGAVAVLLANGSGFAAATLVPTDSAGVVAVSLGDLDGDGDLDLVAANRVTRNVHRLFNDGVGHFAGLASTRIPGEVSRLWVADLDRDGRADLLTGNRPELAIGSFFGRAASASWTMLGTGGGAFAAPVRLGVQGLIALGAFSGAGQLDAFVIDSVAVGICHDLGNGTFATVVRTPGIWGCGESHGVAIDLDGDGRDELIGDSGAACSDPHSSGVFRIDDALAFVHRDDYAATTGITPLAADMNGDGRLDAVFAGGVVALNHDGRLDGARLILRTADGSFSDLRDIDCADLNADGTDDVVVTSVGGAGGIFHARPDGHLDPGFSLQPGPFMRRSAIADVDGDGDRDILTLYSDSGQEALYTWFNDGTGHMAARVKFPLSGLVLTVMVVADFDADGDVDLLASRNTDTNRTLFLNDGVGNWTMQATTLPTTGTYGPADGDALPARFSISGDSIVITHATGVGQLGPPVPTWTGGPLVIARFADLDLDGRTDALCLMAGGQVRAFLGQSGGSWSIPVDSPGAPIAPGYAPVFEAIGDLDGDNRPDLLFSGAGSPAAISVLRNLGGGLFGERGDSFTHQTFGNVIADVDGDGAGDLLGIVGSSPDSRAATLLFGATHASIPTPALVSLISATSRFDRANLAWYVPADGPAVLSLERRGDSGWSAVVQVRAVAGRAIYEDRAVEPGATYEWRLSWSEDGARHYSDIARLTIAARASFAMAGMRPNPVDGDRVRIELSLEKLDPVEVRIADLAGRVLAVRRFEPAAGARDFVVDGLGDLPAGLYFVRASQGSQHASRMLVRVR